MIDREPPPLADSPGARLLRGFLPWAPVLAVGGAILASGPPEGVTDRGWRTAAVFAATIIGFLSRPLPMGPMVLVALVALLAMGGFGAGKSAVAELLDGFGDSTVWLVVAAFLLSGTVVRTGLGKRVALLLIRWLGRTTLGLGYAITATEVLLGAVIPSSTARGGGVISPIVLALAKALGASPDGPRRSTGGFLVLCGAHANLLAAAMYLTGMAANPQLSLFAYQVWGIRWDWTSWLLGSIVPALATFALMPLLLFKLCPPDLADACAARDEAANELTAMGPWSGRQRALAALLTAMVVAWATEPLHGFHSTSIALAGLALMLVTGIERWDNFTGDRAAWDALMWLGGLVAMAQRLKTEGVVDWFAEQMQAQVSGLSGVTTAIVLAIIYFYSMYGFSMMTGHIVALAFAFFSVAKAADSPPLLTIAMISYFSNLCGCLTNYSTGPVVIYFGFGYVTPRRWFGIGFVVGLFHLTVWLGLGLPWWKMLGWW